MEFNWSPQCEEAFVKLKNILCEAPILAYPDFSQPFVLFTDASGVGIGAVLAQIGPDDKEHVISYASRSLKKHERNYGITDLEILAIVWAMSYYRPYLMGTTTRIITDHQASQDRKSVV